MKNKLEIVAKLLQEKNITVEEAVTLLETQYVPSYQQVITTPNLTPDWTYRPGPIYCGTTQTSNINKITANSSIVPEYGC